MKCSTYREFCRLLFTAMLAVCSADRTAGNLCAEDPVARPAEAESAQRHSSISQAELKRFIKELGSDSYKTRKAAAKILLTHGEAAIPLLHQAVRSEDPDVSSRALKLLEKLFFDRKDVVAAAAEDLLAEIRNQPSSPAATEAKRVLDLNVEAVETRAIPRIRKAGGIVKLEDPMRIAGFQNAKNADEGIPSMVILNRSWKRTRANLEQITRLPRVRTIYYVKNVLSAEDIKTLQKLMPGTTLQERGAACLGVSGRNHPLGCQIGFINPGSAADNGGLRQIDVITHFAGEAVESFDHLVELIAKHDPGEVVKVDVQRGIDQLQLSITLQEWK